MPILSYGIYKPSLKDQADVVFPATENNWQQVNDHNHDGVNSVLISANTLLPSQAGNAGKFLTTNGTNVSWAPALSPDDNLVEFDGAEILPIVEYTRQINDDISIENLIEI